MIRGLQCILVEFLAFDLVASPILPLATEQITAFQVFSTELMFAILNFVANSSILDEFLNLSTNYVLGFNFFFNKSFRKQHYS